MEFLHLERTLESLGIAGFFSKALETPEDSPNQARFTLSPDAEQATLLLAPSISLTEKPSYTLAVTGPADLSARLDDVLHALHAQEVILIPVGTWRATLDSVAFALAEDEAWQEIDAEASLHQHKRSPLAFPPAQRATLIRLIGSVLETGSDAVADLTLLAPDIGVAIEVRAAGSLLITLTNRAAAEALAAKVGAE